MILIPAVIYAQDKEENILDKFSYTVDEFTGDTTYYPKNYDSWGDYIIDNMNFQACLVKYQNDPGASVNNFLMLSLNYACISDSKLNPTTAYIKLDDKVYEISLKSVRNSNTSTSAGKYIYMFALPLYNSDGITVDALITYKRMDELISDIANCTTMKARIDYSENNLIIINSKELQYVKDYILLFNFLLPKADEDN